MSPFAKRCGLLALSLIPQLAAADGKVNIQLPPEAAALKPGPGQDVVQASWIACHSDDYIYMQPPLTEAQWRAVVVKMKKAMGAPIADEDMDAVVRYLVSQNGKKE